MVKGLKTSLAGQRRFRALRELLLVLTALVLLNFVGQGIKLRLDFTEDGRYTLSRSTKNILRDLPQVLTLRVYFSEELPPELIPFRRELEELLVEYEAEADGQLVYAFENPNESPELEQKAQQVGIAPATLNVRRRDKVEQMRVYMGIALNTGDKKELIPFLQTDRSPEHALTMAIKKLTLQKKEKLALIQGHGEPTLENLSDLSKALSVLYEPTAVDLSTTPDLKKTDYAAILWFAPRDTIASTTLAQIDSYLSEGGRLLLIHNPLTQNFSSQVPSISRATTAASNLLSPWLKKIGIQQQSNFVVVDAQCGRISVAQQIAGMVFNTQLEFPYFPTIVPEKEHPITKDLKVVQLQASAPIRYSPADSSLRTAAHPLLRSSENTGLKPIPAYINIQQAWGKNDFDAGQQWLGLALKGAPLPAAEARLVLFGDASLVVPQQEKGQLPPANLLLVSNAIDWLCDDTGLIELRSKGISARPLRQLEDSTKNWISYLNLLLPLLLVLGYGLIRWQILLTRRRAEARAAVAQSTSSPSAHG